MIVALDSFYRFALSKRSTKKGQKAWACQDAIAIRFRLCYVFGLVRTQAGSTGARYPTLGQLKEMVATTAVKRRNSELMLDPTQRLTQVGPLGKVSDLGVATSAPDLKRDRS